jgi:dTDP-4-amino-4,6-dideoxygalactose transaminase
MICSMHTFSPSPNWSDLFFGSLSAVQRPCANKTPWRSKNKEAIWFLGGTAILTHIARACSNDLGTRPPTMWLPDYFCNSSTRGLRDIGTEVRHYPITSALEPNWLVMENMLKDQRAPDVFLLVHYFGKAADASRAAAFCRETGALLIEDAAHALIAHGDMGCHGDAIFYCLHKVLAAPDGAILVHRDPRLTISAFNQQQYGDVPSTWLAKRVAQKLLPAAALRHRVRQLPGFSTDLPGEPLDLQTRPSSVGQSMINRYADRLTAITTNRKRTAASWRAAFQAHGAPYTAFFSEEEEGPVPYRFIVKCPDTMMAIKLFDAFRTEGVAIESWPDLAPEIKRNATAHRVACGLRDTLLFLPVFQVLPATVEPVVRRRLQITQRI